MKQKGNALTIVLTVIAIIIIGAAAYYAGSKGLLIKQASTPVATPSPTDVSSFTPTPTSSPTSQTGTVSGKLCYPSSFVPPGEIVAKDTTTAKTYSQNYIGSVAGGSLTYAFQLPAGIYHLKYQAHASTTKPDVFTSGYYDECAKTMATAECTPDTGHINISVTVTAGAEAKNVDLCDFYYNPTQMASLESSF